MNDDLISRRAAIEYIQKWEGYDEDGRAIIEGNPQSIYRGLEQLPPAQPDSCDGCKHMGLWENEVEYGYPSPCTGCKRRASDNYER